MLGRGSVLVQRPHLGRQSRNCENIAPPKLSGAFGSKSELLSFQRAMSLVRIRLVKSVASLLLLSAFALTACNNLVTRRDQYRPGKASGPYTEARRTGKLPTHEQLAEAQATPTPAMEASEETALSNP